MTSELDEHSGSFSRSLIEGSVGAGGVVDDEIYDVFSSSLLPVLLSSIKLFEGEKSE